MIISIEVGLTKKLPNGKKTRYKYNDVKFDEDGWAYLPCYYPLKFDLVHGKTGENKIRTVWWTGKDWVGLRKSVSDIFIAWKRIPYVGSTS